MKRPGFSRKHAGAFTLVELVIVLTIIALLVGIAVPSIRGLQDESIAREPVAALVSMAREVRSRAMAEGEPYQVVFDASGFKAARYFNPYGESAEFDQLIREVELELDRQEMVDASRERGIDLSLDGQPPTAEELKLEAVREGMQFYETYELPDGVGYELHYWGEIDWVDMMGSGEFRRWVFQPNGMCQPLEIRIQSDRAFFEVSFHPLTGDVKTERSWVE